MNKFDILKHLGVKPGQKFRHDCFPNLIFEFTEDKQLHCFNKYNQNEFFYVNPLTVIITIIENPDDVHIFPNQVKFTPEQVTFTEYLLGHIPPNEHPRICRGFETYLYWMTDDMEEVASQARLPYEIFPNILTGESYTLQQIKENQL